MKNQGKLIKLVLKAIGLAMGVVVLVLSVLGKSGSEINIFMGIGLFAISLCVFNEGN
jgi:hypothetical protein